MVPEYQMLVEDRMLGIVPTAPVIYSHSLHNTRRICSRVHIVLKRLQIKKTNIEGMASLLKSSFLKHSTFSKAKRGCSSGTMQKAINSQTCMWVGLTAERRYCLSNEKTGRKKHGVRVYSFIQI